MAEAIIYGINFVLILVFVLLLESVLLLLTENFKHKSEEAMRRRRSGIILAGEKLDSEMD